MLNYNEIKAQVPSHLQKYVVDQNYSRYTAEDQAAWRYILRELTFFLKDHAHPCYVEGLRKTGISQDKIPRISEVSEKLQNFGWRALPVSGFIPPAAFMELQSLGFLPVASDMRSIDHILYTPAPDIVHEAAGHAPILIEPDFAQYLKNYAQVACKSVLFSHDLAQYEAIRFLSDLKESDVTRASEVKEAEARLKAVNESIKETSEAGLLGRMNWWTAEYGLIGDINNPKIFGAGLLSSISESKECLNSSVKKIPLSLECLDYSYDITEPQPQLFVARDFEHLNIELSEMAKSLSFNKKAIESYPLILRSQTVNTAKLSSGILISGKYEEFEIYNSEICFLKTSGPSQISFNEQQIKGHGTDYHSTGYSSPIGRLKGGVSWSSINPLRASELGWRPLAEIQISFESGFTVKGKIKDLLFEKDIPLLISLSDCTVSRGDKIYFQPDWGTFDLAPADSVKSLYGGAADRGSYGHQSDFEVKRVPERRFDTHQSQLHSLMAQLKNYVDSENRLDFSTFGSRNDVLNSRSWILLLEVYQAAIIFQNDAIATEAKQRLNDIANSSLNEKVLIESGILAIENMTGSTYGTH